MEDQLEEFTRIVNGYMTRLARKAPHPMAELANETGLTVPQAAFLVFLYESGSSSVSDISKQWHISQSVATRMMDRLVDKKMIERERGRDDRRVVHARLTGEGERFVKQVCSKRNKITKEIFSVLSEDERSLFLELLMKIDERYE
ncbi:MAG: winged helix-turn-helix transcriptional regulator [Actinobacteria bacterium]|nr:winged helix-turn-helix transcriptional regulator [Actinomycetota bacterium]